MPAITARASRAHTQTTAGSTVFPFTQMVRDTIEAHGLSWAVAYYMKRLPQWEARFFLRAALRPASVSISVTPQ